MKDVVVVDGEMNLEVLGGAGHLTLYANEKRGRWRREF